MHQSEPQIPAELLQALKRARDVVVSTGAGISAESGVPTFREAQQGLWERFRPEDLATPEAFERDPESVWQWYQWRRKLIREVEPNAGHRALSEMAKRFAAFTLITQNVDGLHQRAGSQDVIELHGSIARSICHRTRRPMEDIDEDAQTPPASPFHPQGLARPDVVWFGEALTVEALEAAFAASRNCELFFSVGTSAQVQPAASLPLMARESGALVVEINPESTPLTALADFSLHGPSGRVLPELLAAL